MVECQLPKLKVAGSIPVARSIDSRATVDPVLTSQRVTPWARKPKREWVSPVDSADGTLFGAVRWRLLAKNAIFVNKLL